MAQGTAQCGEVALRRISKLILVLAMIGAAVILFRNSLLLALGKHLDMGCPPTKVDFVVLLPGDEATRAFVVAGLVRNGYAPIAVLIPSKLYDQDPSDAPHVVGRDILQSQGISTKQIIQLPDWNSDSTFSDAESLRAFLEDQDLDCRLIVVTNDYHTRRSVWTFRQVLKHRMKQIQFVSAPADYHSAETWWHSRQGAYAYLSEYFKLGFYMLRYSRQNRIMFLGTFSLILASMTLSAVRRRKRRREQNATNLAGATESGNTV